MNGSRARASPLACPRGFANRIITKRYWWDEDGMQPCDPGERPRETDYMLASEVDAARLATEQQHQQRERELQAEIAELHDIVSGYDAITDPEEQPELHERASKALGDGSDHTICRALQASEQHTARLRAALESALPYLEEHQDAGPTWEGWKSDDLLALISEIESALAASPAPQETDR